MLALWQKIIEIYFGIIRIVEKYEPVILFAFEPFQGTLRSISDIL
jgi:hypothetical protein